MKFILTYSFILIATLGMAQLDNFKAGNESYEAGDYDLAIEKYGTVIAQGNHSADLYFNLGNAHYRNDEIGKSIWAYESALKIEPDHEDALFNLEFVNAQTIEKIDTQRHGFIHWLQGIAFTSNINFWVFVSVLCSIIFSLLASLFIRSKKRSVRNISLLTSALFGIGLMISLVIGYLHKDYITSRSNGVVITEKIDVLVSPIEDSKISYKLGEGAKVDLVSDEKDWVEIDLNGNKGWVQKKDIWEI